MSLNASFNESTVEDATIWSAFNQLQTYKQQIGSLTANTEWFKVWRTVDGEHDVPMTALSKSPKNQAGLA